MRMTKLQKATATVLFLGISATGVWLHGTALADPAPAAATPERLDATGSPLPAAVDARFGTLQWRHAQPVVFVAYTADAKQLITGTQDGMLHVWDIQAGKELRKFGKPGQLINNPNYGREE